MAGNSKKTTQRHLFMSYFHLNVSLCAFSPFYQSYVTFPSAVFMQSAVYKGHTPVMFHICSWTLYLASTSCSGQPQPHIVLLSCKVFHCSSDPNHTTNPTDPKPKVQISTRLVHQLLSYNFSSYVNTVSSSDGYVSTSDGCQDMTLAGSLIYLMTWTRPDLCYVVMYVMYLSQHLL